MESKVNYVIVGLFVLLLGAALFGVVLWLGKADYRGVYERYYAYMKESVAGLSVNSPVKYRGVEVGRVKEIILNPENLEEVRLTLDIIEGTPVKEDTVAVLDIQGLTGLAIVDLTGGTRQASTLVAKPHEEYPVIKAGPSLAFRLDRTLSRLLADQPVTHLLDNLVGLTQDTRTLVDEENRAALKKVLQDLSQVTDALAERSDELDRGLASGAQAMENLAATTQALRTSLPPVMERISRSAAALDGVTKDMSQASTAVTTVVKETRPDIERFTRHTLVEAGFLVTELRDLTASLQRVARQLERDPNALIFGRHTAAPGPGE